MLNGVLKVIEKSYTVTGALCRERDWIIPQRIGHIISLLPAVISLFSVNIIHFFCIIAAHYIMPNMLILVLVHFLLDVSLC